MLGKLLKHEWKSTCKIMTAANLTLLLLTLTGCCILNTDIFDSQESALLAVFLIIFYALSLAAFSIITGIYLYTRFYRNLFTSQGYLMHTLPVTPLQLFHSKLLVGYFWSSVNALLTILSVILLSFVAGYHYVDTYGAENVQDLLQDLDMVISTGNGDWTISFRNLFGYTPLQILGLMILLQLSGSLASLLMGYVSILLGQLMEKYRLACAIGFYIALYIGNQIISSVLILSPTLYKSVSTMGSFLNSYYKNMLPAAVFSQLILSFIFYMVSVLLMRRKLNLD